jgi:iron complex transport system ATP-binding protein
MSKLRAENLAVGYDKQNIISGLNLAIPAGRITALVGSNGSGKSTLLRALARLLKPQVGTILLDGKAIYQQPTRAVARQLGILPQNPLAPEGLTVRELVAQGRYPHQSLLRQWSQEDERVVTQALETAALTELADRPVETLSGGQKQRAWIAMALAQDTATLLLDEPTSFLDIAHQVEVLDLLDELNQAENRTIVMVLHDLNQACRYADYLVALKDGQIVAEGDPSLIVTVEMVQAVFNLECQIISDPLTGTPLCLPIPRKVRLKV